MPGVLLTSISIADSWLFMRIMKTEWCIGLHLEVTLMPPVQYNHKSALVDSRADSIADCVKLYRHYTDLENPLPLYRFFASPAPY